MKENKILVSDKSKQNDRHQWSKRCSGGKENYEIGDENDHVDKVLVVQIEENKGNEVADKDLYKTRRSTDLSGGQFIGRRPKWLDLVLGYDKFIK